MAVVLALALTALVQMSLCAPTKLHVHEPMVRFDGHKVLAIEAPTAREVTLLHHFQVERTRALSLDWWKEPRAIGSPVHVRVTPSNLELVPSPL